MMKRISGVLFLLFEVIVVGCGGTTAAGDASIDGTVDVDATTAVDGSMTDGTVQTDAAGDAPADAAVEAGMCASLDAGACTTCCIAQAGGTGGFELIYYNQCLQCASCGPNVKPCGTSMSPPPSGGCVLCLQLDLKKGQPWAMCQQSAQCKAFAECFAQCPTK